MDIAGFEDDKAHEKLVKEIEERHDYLFRQLTPVFNNMSRYWRLYLGERRDNRKEHEKWRALSWLGDPYHQTETEALVWADILNGMDPAITSEGVDKADEAKARGFVRAGDYFLRSMKWTYIQEQALRSCSIQGWTLLEPVWREESFTILARPSQQQRVQFDMAVSMAQKQGLPSPPDPYSEPQEFALWVDEARKLYPQMPAPPGMQNQTITTYRGPWMNRPSDFEFRFDPYVENWGDQELVIKRVIKPRKWIEQKVKEGVYSKEMVEKSRGKGSTSDNRLSQWDREIAEKIGLTFNESDPVYKDSDELWECWRPKEKLPYLVICNRTAVINRRPDLYPYYYRKLPFICIRNTPMKGQSIGMSSHQQLEKTYGDRVKFRDILLDGLVLSVMPVFLKSRNLGMSDMSKFLEPGKIIEVNDPAGFKPGWQSMAGFSELMSIGQTLLQDQNLFLSTGENVRGSPSQVGRVSATEAQSRLSQALVRHKQKAIRLEEEFSDVLPWMFALVFQKWPSEDPELAQLRQKMVGEDEPDPFTDFTRDTFMEALNMDIKFRGASRVMNRELHAQQLKDFLQMGASLQVAPGIPALTGIEVRNGLRRIYETLGHKGAADLVTAEGDQLVLQGVQSAQLQVQTALAQQQQQLQQLQQPPQPQPPPPQRVPYQAAPPDIQRQMEQAAGMQPSQMDPRTPPQPQPQPGLEQMPPELMGGA